MTEPVLQIIVVSVVLVAHLLTRRSRKRREAGVCCSCGKPATAVLALDSFCEECSQRTARTYRAGSRLFAFMAVFTAFMFGWMWFESRGGEEIALPWSDLGMSLLLLGALVVWLRRGPDKRGISR
jgi:hypothetical protein